MKKLTHYLNQVLAITALFCFSLSAPAMPKAAEHIDAPVTSGADVAKPKRYVKSAQKPVSKTPRNAAKKKSGHPSRKLKAKNK